MTDNAYIPYAVERKAMLIATEERRKAERQMDAARQRLEDAAKAEMDATERYMGALLELQGGGD